MAGVNRSTTESVFELRIDVAMLSGALVASGIASSHTTTSVANAWNTEPIAESAS